MTIFVSKNIFRTLSNTPNIKIVFMINIRKFSLKLFKIVILEIYVFQCWYGIVAHLPKVMFLLIDTNSITWATAFIKLLWTTALHEKQPFHKNAQRKYHIFRKTKIKENIIFSTISDSSRNKSMEQDND